MKQSDELYIDQEVRIRLMEEVYKDIRDELKEMRNHIDSHFKWIIGTIITLFGGIILHMAKLI